MTDYQTAPTDRVELLDGLYPLSYSFRGKDRVALRAMKAFASRSNPGMYTLALVAIVVIAVWTLLWLIAS